jgi:hypothetical protein
LCDARLNLFASHPTTIYAVIDVDFLKCDGDLIRLVGVGLAGDPRIMEIDLLTRRGRKGQFGDHEITRFHERYPSGERIDRPT